MRLYGIESRAGDGTATLTARALPDGGTEPLDLTFRFEGLWAVPAGVGGALAVGMLCASMFRAESLSVEGPLPRTLLGNIGAAQKLLASWYPWLSPVAIASSGISEPSAAAPRAQGVACCFTGGVDSWYSLLKNRAAVTHLLLVRGFDISLTNDVLWNETRARAREVAQSFGLRLVTCETNLRELTDMGRVNWERSPGPAFAGDFWGQCLHGSALAAVGLLLQGVVGTLIVPATHTFDRLRPWGSTPDLDPLWSDDRLKIVHDGCEANRVEKIARLATSDLALRTLRVCYHNTAAYNCGRCEKCLRTMLGLRLCGALERATTFPEPISLARARRFALPAHVMHHYETLAAAARAKGDTELVRTLEVLMGRRFSMPRALALVKRGLRARAAALRIRPPAEDSRLAARPTAQRE